VAHCGVAACETQEQYFDTVPLRFSVAPCTASTSAILGVRVQTLASYW
jgi:hypothetical protein